MRGCRCALVVLAAVLALSARAAEPQSQPTYQQELERQAQQEEAREAAWRQRWKAHTASEKQAEQRLEAARSARGKMGDHRTWRGKSRADVLQELDSAEQGLERARKELRDFYAEAHRAGIPPGWVGHPD